MHGYLRQATAAQVRTIGPFVDDTDFKTLENALTLANTDILIKKNGAASTAKNSGGATADGAGGLYHLTWDATDTGTVGELSYAVKVAGALVVFGSYVVLEEAVYDALFAASAPGYLQPTVAARTLDVSAAGNAGIDWSNIEAPTSAQNLSATNIDVDQVVASVSGAVGSVTAGVTLANDAITAAKFDETTAFPLKADDSGATQVARVGADADTLETLSDQLDAKASQASVDDLPTNAELAAALVSNEGPALPSGSVTPDGGNSATAFETDRTETADDFWKDALLLITSGALIGQVKKVSAYNGTTKIITVSSAFTGTPADGVTFLLVNR
jgi:hypothetical protein